MKYLIPIFAFFLIACSGKINDDRTDDEKMRDEVRSYLFLDDTVAVSANVVDTIMVSDLDGMLATIEDNLMKIQWDIDTLETMIDTLAYENLEYEQHLYPESIELKMASRNLRLTEYKLKMADLQATKMGFKQSKRVMLHLRRAQLNTVAGYEVVAHFIDKGENVELGFVMTADFRIVD